jgi:acetylornithine deacetylase/succinyl-diaminopimelate desuccinylase-like protein
MRRRLAGILWLLLLCAPACSRRSPIRSQVERDQVRPAAEWLQLEPVRLLRDYIRIDTTSRGVGEEKGAVFLQKFFECAGIETELVCPAPGRCNVLARIPGRRREGALLLLNHIDVVGVFPEYWKEAPPFSGTIKAGYLYGRGTYDMKGLGISQAIAMRRLADARIVPETDILFLGEADEEFEQKWGSRWLLDHRPDWFRGVTTVLNEGGNNEAIIRTLRFWGVEADQAGYGSLEFEASSEEPLKALAARFPKLEGPASVPSAQVLEGFDLLANHLPYPWSVWLRDPEGLIHNRANLSRLADRYGAFFEPRIHWSTPFAFPPNQRSKFRSYVIVSVPPGASPDLYLDPIAAAARDLPLATLERESSGRTVPSPWPTETTELLKRVTAAFHPGLPFGPVPTFGAMTTSQHFRKAGIPAYGYSPILMNITDEARRHGNDERLFLRDYLDGIEILDQVVKEYAFFPPGHKASAPRGEK